MSTEHNIATFLAQKMFPSYNSSLLRQNTVNQYFPGFYPVSNVYYLVIQLYF